MSRFFAPVTATHLALLALATACSGGGSKPCDPLAQTGCADKKVCEGVQGATPACFDPVVLTGTVTDLAAASALSAARIVALDANRAPASNVAISDVNGHYELPLPRDRAADGTPVAGQVTLRADRAGYQSFPGGLRVALPVDVSAPVHANGKWTVASSLTDLELIALPAGSATASVHGTVAAPPGRVGVLVVAEPAAGGTGVSGIADKAGQYAVFNLPAGASYDVTAYATGANYAPAAVDLAAGDDKQVDLVLKNTSAATVTGVVNPVSGASGLPTSVILVVESTFNANLGRGDAPPGLRDPSSGLAVTSAFSIAGVPDGKYVALAAFENDGLVRDTGQTGGTAPLEVVVANGAMTSAPGSFKITTPVSLKSPGVSGAEIVTASQPQFVWSAYPATDHYDVTVYDAFGNVQWKYTYLHPPTSGDVSVTYGAAGGTPPAPSLTPGMYYQVVVESFGTQPTQYSRSEDLEGVFQYGP